MSDTKLQSKKTTSRFLQHKDSKGFSVEKTCSVIKLKIEKSEDEEKEKMTFCPKGNCHVLHFLCKHELAKIAGKQGWKLILEDKDGKLVAKLLVKNETAIEECRDKLRNFITKALPNLHQVNFDLSPLSSTTHSNSGNRASNQGSDHDNREHSDKVHSNRNHDNKDPLQKSLACLLPLVAGVQNRAHLLYNKDSNCLVITGETETVKQLHMKAKAKLYIITMKTGLKSTLQGHLVRTFGIIGQLKGRYPDVGAVLEDCNTKFTWTGTEENITICRQEMEKLIGEIKTLNFPVSAMLQKLLSVPEIKSLIDTLLQKEGIICVWQVKEAKQVQVWSAKSSSAKLFELKIRENFKEQSFSVKDFPFVLEVSSSGFGLSATKMKHVVVEETNDAVNVAAMSNTMQNIIQHLQTKEDPHSAGSSGSKEGDNPAGIQTNSCTIEVRGMSQHTSDDTVELYFESRRAAGQPVDIEKFDASKRQRDGVIFITYETAEVVELVLDRQHVLDKCPLTVQLFQESESAPSKFYQEKNFFRSMNTTTTQNSLESFLRSKVQETPREFLYGKEDGTVLVSFNGCPDFEKLKHACQQSPLDECFLEAERVPISHCVSVYGAQEKTTCNTLEYYFENRRRSGGSDVSEVKEISTGTFIITFEDSSVVDRVCQRTHVVDGCTLTVQVFYQVLGFRHSYAQPPLKVPSSLVITDPNQLQRIKASGSAELEKQLAEQYVKLNWPEDGSGHLKLECLITEGVTDSHRLVLTWQDVVKDILNKFLTQTEITKAQVALPKEVQDLPAGATGSGQASSGKNLNKDRVRKSNPIQSDRKEHFKRSNDDFEHVSDINIGMSEETFLAIQFFCRGDWLMQQHSFGYYDGMLQIHCKDNDEKKNIETSIKSKLKYLEVMNKDDVSFTPAEEPKIKGTIDQIHKDMDGVYCYRLKEDEHSVVHVMAHSYSQLQTVKHKILQGIGRIKQTVTRRNRRFDHTTSQQGERTLTEKNKFSQSYHGSRALGQPPQSTFGYGSVTPKDFTTIEGLLVKVYSGSILHLDVDCIVNAANGDLQHGGGVARVISDAAGYEFDKESRDYIYRHDPLRVGEVCTTTAGNLKYKGVIHAVGPRWYDYGQDQKHECLHDLKEAIKNSLEEADFQRYKSIAIPAISSGIFGVPKELCTQQYYRAVEEYSHTRRSHATLTEVHFIDNDTQMCQLIQTTFTKCFTGGHGAGSGDKHSLSSSFKPSTNTIQKFGRSNSLPLDSNTDGTSVDPDPTDSSRSQRLPTPSGQTFEIGNNLTVRVVHGNIVDINADAIVSPENIQCDSNGRIAREITRVAGEDYVETDQSQLRLSLRKLTLTEVVETLAGRSQFKYVLHVVAPEWDAAAIADQGTYWTNLEKSYKNVFSLVDRKHLDITSIALPILGTGTVPDHSTPIRSISSMLARICKDYAETTPTKKNVYICNDDAVAIYTLKGIFEKTFSEKNETKDDRGGQEETQRCHDQGSKVTEDCCICMDTITDPKKLSCGHVFCRECIDLQFKYKPTCPQCGAVHGKIMGDQPTGTIDIKTSKWYGRHSSIPGYPGYGIISITYNFPSGKQGSDHPTPGKCYQGISRTAYLPDNDKGRLVSKLLNVAFKRKLVFTIGRSRTTGNDGVVTWNDIHHKTRVGGGPQAFGYPDATYLDRVLDELKAKGVTEESLKDP